MHRPGDVLDLLLAQILERDVEFVAHLIVHDPADANPARLGESFQARGDVDPVAVDVSLLDDHVAQIDADAQLYPVVRRDISVPLGHRLLHRDRRAGRAQTGGHPRG